jgi:hypothetical protein
MIVATIVYVGVARKMKRDLNKYDGPREIWKDEIYECNREDKDALREKTSVCQ